MIELLAARLKSLLRGRRSTPGSWRSQSRPRPRPRSDRADERTLRRLAESERGGFSSRESVARYERGENPGGLHHRAVRRDGPEHPRHHPEEPSERKEKVPGGTRRIPVMRRGS
jgi:hypothetical protein